mgnify:CR=1 FL=1
MNIGGYQFIYVLLQQKMKLLSIISNKTVLSSNHLKFMNMNKLKNLLQLALVTLVVATMTACSDNEDSKEEIGKQPKIADYIEVPVNDEISIYVPTGYKLSIKDTTIVKAQGRFYNYFVTFLQGKKKGETEVTVYNPNEVNSSKTIPVKVTDSYISAMIMGSNHPFCSKNAFLFFINDDKHHFYLFNKEDREPAGKPIAEGTYKFSVKKETSIEYDKNGKEIETTENIPYLTLTYNSDKDGRYDASAPLTAHEFCLVKSTGMVMKAFKSYLSDADWDALEKEIESSEQSTRSKAVLGIGLVMQDTSSSLIIEGDLYNNYFIPQHILE